MTNNPTTPAIGDEPALSDERIDEIWGESQSKGWRGFARALIAADRAARQAPVVPAGWKLVPIEATLRQMAAMGPAIRACYGLDGVNGDVRAVYAAMLSAAPASPLQQAQDGERDTERLDWLQRDMLFSEPTGITWEDGAFCFPYLVSGDGGLGGGVGMARFRSLREAIDAARSQAEGGKEDES